jgi:single-stranded-DNA-specific exonuclease RecJ
MFPNLATQWQYRSANPHAPAPEALVKACGGQQLLAKLLENRGVDTPAAVKAWLEEPSMDTLCPPEDLPDFEAALERISQALEHHEPVMVYGDFDVDGVTGTSILVETLRYLGANVSFFIPNRATQGHGLNSAALCRLVSARKLKLVVTTDTGISNFNEISLLKGLGVDVIVTDHHELPEHLPPSVANVNPLRLPAEHPLALMSGAGVAFKLCQSLLELHAESPEAAQDQTQRLLDLCAIGLIADMVPLQRENRALVRLGLQQLQRRQRVGLLALLEAAGTAPEAQLNAETVGFTIGPRINALGRLSDATEAVTLLTTADKEEATRLALQLEHHNKRRQELCDSTFLEAEQHLQAMGGLGGRRAIILASPQWNPGIIGIVASRLIERYHVPTFLMVVDETANVARCSARSIKGFHLTEHLQHLADYFLHMGGHAGAAGFALPLEKLPAFKEALWARAAVGVSEAMMHPSLEVDAPLSAHQLNEGLLQQLEQLAPCGMGNPAPLFVLEEAQLMAQRPLGEAKRHLKLLVTPKNSSTHGQGGGANAPVEALIWQSGPESPLQLKSHYHLAVAVERNTFEGNPSPLRCVVKGLQPAAGTLAGTQRSANASLQQARIVGHTGPSPAVAEAPFNAPVQVVDHRDRPHLEEFVGQLLTSTPSARLYNEGRPPKIPFLKAEQVLGRNTLQPAGTLLLWDYPPTAADVLALVKATGASTVHLLGAKYKEVPLQLPCALFLKGVYQSVLALQQQGTLAPMGPRALACRFATTPAVVQLALAVLHHVGALMAPSSVVPQGLGLQVAEGFVWEEALWPSAQQQAPYLCHAFEEALSGVAQFRGGLAQAPTAHWLRLLCVEATILGKPSVAEGLGGLAASTAPAAVLQPA